MRRRRAAASTTRSPTATAAPTPATVTVDITCVNDEPVAGDDDASGTEDTDVTISDGDLAANDTDADGDTLTVTGVDNASGGTVSLDAGTITFIPDANLCGDDAACFDYTVDDGDGGTDTGTVTIDLTCVNDNPVATDDDVDGRRGHGDRRHRREPPGQRHRRRRRHACRSPASPTRPAAPST